MYHSTVHRANLIPSAQANRRQVAPRNLQFEADETVQQQRAGPAQNLDQRE
jgi:hypothetical protein